MSDCKMMLADAREKVVAKLMHALAADCRSELTTASPIVTFNVGRARLKLERMWRMPDDGTFHVSVHQMKTKYAQRTENGKATGTNKCKARSVWSSHPVHTKAEAYLRLPVLINFDQHQLDMITNIKSSARSQLNDPICKITRPAQL